MSIRRIVLIPNRQPSSIARVRHGQPYNRSSLRRIITDTSQILDRPRVVYQQAHLEEDPFPDPLLLDPVDPDQQVDFRTAIDGIVKTANADCLSGALCDELLQQC